MTSYLFAWNPSRWRWKDLDARLRDLARHGSFEYRWSCGNTKTIEPNSRFFLIRLGPVARGIVGGGVVLSPPSEAPHWDPERASRGHNALYANVRFDFLQNEPLVHWTELKQPPLASFRWATQKSGIRIPREIAARLEARLAANPGHEFSLADELRKSQDFPEGVRKQVTVNAYERNPQARAACIAHFGARCAVCGLDFGKRYGDVAVGYIHVHHLNPVAAVGRQYRVNPVRDLRPICPNCHAVVHLEDPPMSINRLRQLVLGSTLNGRVDR